MVAVVVHMEDDFGLVVMKGVVYMVVVVVVG